MPDQLADRDESWDVVASDDLHRDDWVMALRRDTVQSPGADEEFSRLVLEHPGAVVVLALDTDDRVLCLRQYRHPAQRRFVELPAGLLDGDDGEAPVEVARRELREEGEYAAADWRHLTSTYPSPGILTEVHHYFLARDLTPIGRGDFELKHEEADMDVLWVPIQELTDAVLAGDLTDGPLVIAVLAYDALRRRDAL